jgi:hypothetical protein
MKCRFMDCDPALPRVMKAFEEEYVAESMIEGLEFGTELPLAKHFMAGTIYSRRSI